MKKHNPVICKGRSQLLALTALFIPLLLAGCASLQPRVNEVSLQSYQQGCALRGIRQGLSSAEAQALCECHVDTAIEQTSRETFLHYVDLVGNASPEQKNTEAFKNALQLIKTTFNDCRQQSSEASP